MGHVELLVLGQPRLERDGVPHDMSAARALIDSHQTLMLVCPVKPTRNTTYEGMIVSC